MTRLVSQARWAGDSFPRWHSSEAGLACADAFRETTQQLRQLGVTDVILYPLDSGRGWRDALDRTLDELAPTR